MTTTLVLPAASATEQPDVRADRIERRRYFALLLPPIVLLIVLFVYPVVGLLRHSVITEGFTLDQYRRVFSEPVYLTVFLITFRTAAYTTIICLVLGYPLAYVIVNLPKRLQAFALALVVVPFFISLIVRTYAWMVLLGRRGLVNSALEALSLGDEPVQLMYSQAGALIGMSYALLPFMILTCFGVMRTIDSRYMQAAYSLGASGRQSFLRVFLPLSMPGVLGGTILVFIMSLGFFITPRLMGGPSDLMIAMLIEHEVEMTLNWPFAAALSVLLLALTLVGFFAYARLVKLEAMFEAKL